MKTSGQTKRQLHFAGANIGIKSGTHNRPKAFWHKIAKILSKFDKFYQNCKMYMSNLGMLDESQGASETRVPEMRKWHKSGTARVRNCFNRVTRCDSTSYDVFVPCEIVSFRAPKEPATRASPPPHFLGSAGLLATLWAIFFIVEARLILLFAFVFLDFQNLANYSIVVFIRTSVLVFWLGKWLGEAVCGCSFSYRYAKREF